MTKPAVAIIGAGKVGSILARALGKRGYLLTGIASRTLESARELAGELGVPAGNAGEVVKNAEIVFITTPDRCIQKTVEDLAGNYGFSKGQIVLHMSGCLPVHVLKAAEEQGALTGCMHPLQSFAGKKHTGEILKDIYFALSGQEEAIKQAQNVVQDLGGSGFTILEQDKALYHGAACIVSNYTVALLHWAGRLLKEIGLSDGQALAALLPLLKGTVKNIQEMGAAASLTGPISRGDHITVKAHSRALLNKQEQNLYRELGKYTLAVALEKGDLELAQADEVLKILEGRDVDERCT